MRNVGTVKTAVLSLPFLPIVLVISVIDLSIDSLFVNPDLAAWEFLPIFVVFFFVITAR